MSAFAIVWAWINFSWFASAYDTDDWVYRLTTMLQMVGVVILALGLAPRVRVDRRGRDRQQRRDGRRLRRDAGRDGPALGAGGPPRPAAACGVQDLHRHDPDRPGRVAGPAVRAHDRGPDVPLDHRARRRRVRRPVARGAAQGRHAVAPAPHRRALRAAGDHRARRGDHRHDRVAGGRRRARGPGLDGRRGARRAGRRRADVRAVVDLLRRSRRASSCAAPALRRSAGATGRSRSSPRSWPSAAASTSPRTTSRRSRC